MAALAHVVAVGGGAPPAGGGGLDYIAFAADCVRIANAGSEIVDLSGGYSHVVIVALKCIQSYAATILCWISAKDLPFDQLPTVTGHIREYTKIGTAYLDTMTPLRVTKLFCDVINATKDFCNWTDCVGLSQYVLAVAGTFMGNLEVYGKKTSFILVYILSTPVQNVANLLSNVLDLVYQCSEIAKGHFTSKVAITISQDIVKIMRQGMSYCPQIYVWKVAVDVCTIYTSSTSLIKMCL